MHKILIASDGAGMINWCTDALCLLVIYLKIYGLIKILMYISTFNHCVTSKNKETTYWLSSRAIKASSLSWFHCGSVNISHERKYHSWGWGMIRTYQSCQPITAHEFFHKSIPKKETLHWCTVYPVIKTSCYV